MQILRLRNKTFGVFHVSFLVLPKQQRHKLKNLVKNIEILNNFINQFYQQYRVYMYIGNENVFYFRKSRKLYGLNSPRKERLLSKNTLSEKKIVELRTIYAFSHKIEYSLYLIK